MALYTMLDESYVATYCDAFGEEETVIHNDGKRLRMVIRGAAFEGKMLDDWEPATTVSTRTDLFPLHNNELHSFRLSFDMSVPVVVGDKVVGGTLRVQLTLGAPRPNRGVDEEKLLLELIVAGQSYSSCGEHGWFDDELREIHEQLPEGSYIKSCFSCAFSDYSPAGYGLFGCMACFRNDKAAYLSLEGKAAYFALQEEIAESVQETYLCSEFEKRGAGSGLS